MKRNLILIFALVALLAGGNGASAQIQPGASPYLPPPPPPPPGPNLDPVAIPKIDQPIPPNVQPSPRSSFSDRIAKCLDQGAAAGLGPNERSNYSRSCANQ